MNEKHSTPSLPTLKPDEGAKSPHNISATQRAKNDAAIQLLAEWMADESGYDEETWPKVKQAIEENRLSNRRRFDD